MKHMIRLFLADLPDTLAMKLAYLMPRRITYWCAVRLMAHASMVFSAVEMQSITPADALRAWSNHP